ncbi:RNA polymerase sigma-70 factor (sigma-E family) [Stackebrandtia albiflava]|uniref:RNA polymerase sigma-70 factor (Sigma-E family) n=2 Tax=Stackebrandtia albiflava TaxID=406432 RepID=A0A562V0W8_9ACTN|nr:RNA polymerase sigma-70 factor (sigma-E family) [Stackebrandtia albiflava]
MRPSHETEYCEFVAANLIPLRRFAYLVCGDWHRAEDAVQTVLTKLYVDWHRTVRRDPQAYVRRMVVNALHDVHRRSWFRRERPAETLPDTAYDRAEATEDRLVLLDALAKLPVRRRATLVLRFWEDRSIEDTARIMGCSETTVKSQTARGLHTLRDLLPNSMTERIEVIPT